MNGVPRITYDCSFFEGDSGGNFKVHTGQFLLYRTDRRELASRLMVHFFSSDHPTLRMTVYRSDESVYFHCFKSRFLQRRRAIKIKRLSPEEKIIETVALCFYMQAVQQGLSDEQIIDPDLSHDQIRRLLDACRWESCSDLNLD